MKNLGALSQLLTVLFSAGYFGKLDQEIPGRDMDGIKVGRSCLMSRDMSRGYAKSNLIYIILFKYIV